MHINRFLITGGAGPDESARIPGSEGEQMRTEFLTDDRPLYVLPLHCHTEL